MDKETRNMCESLIRDAGITTGQTVLDFCCGNGNYTIPAARQVGRKGKVIAVDSDGGKLRELSERAAREHLDKIIELRHTNGELDLDVASASLDVVLLYDVFWYFPLGDRLTVLLGEMYRVLPMGCSPSFPNT